MESPQLHEELSEIRHPAIHFQEDACCVAAEEIPAIDNAMPTLRDSQFDLLGFVPEPAEVNVNGVDDFRPA